MRSGRKLGVAGAIAVSVVFVLVTYGAWQLGVFRPRPAAHPVPAETRDGRWEQDIDYFASQLPRLHHDLFETLPALEFDARVAALRQAIPTLTDQEIQLELARIVVNVGDGHTSLSNWLLNGDAAPITLQWFTDGLFIVSTGEGLENIRSAQVLKIGGADIEAVTESMGRLVSSDNEPYRLYRAEGLLRRVPLLHELGFASRPDTAVFTVVVPSGDTMEVSLAAEHHSAINWVETPSEDLPLYRQRKDEDYWFEYLSDSRTLFFKYNRCRGRTGFRDLAREVKELIEAGDVDRMVIDFRGNGGGNSLIFNWYLLRYLKNQATLNQEGRLFSVIDVGTFSSAKGNSISLERETAATTVGTPTGGKPNQFGEIRPFSLPNSGMKVWYSTKYFEPYPELGDAPNFEPEVLLPLSSEDFFAGRDPVMEWILSGV